MISCLLIFVRSSLTVGGVNSQRGIDGLMGRSGFSKCLCRLVCLILEGKEEGVSEISPENGFYRIFCKLSTRIFL